MREAALLVVVAACGRFGFAGEGDAAGGGVDVVVADVAPPTGDGPPPLACQPQYDICDSFETGINPAVWTTDSMVTLDTTRGHRGSSSIRVHTPAFNQGVNSYQQLEDRNTPLTRTTFWMRGWFWLSTLPASTNGMEMMSAHRAGVAGNYVFVRSTRTNVYSQFEGATDITMTTVPTGQWFCLVFKVVRSTTNAGELDLTGDVPNCNLTGIATDDSAQMLDVVTLGSGFAGSNVDVNQPALDLWIDDVIIDDAAVTCND